MRRYRPANTGCAAATPGAIYLRIMQQGRVAAERITIPEGLASVQVADLLAREEAADR